MIRALARTTVVAACIGMGSGAVCAQAGAPLSGAAGHSARSSSGMELTAHLYGAVDSDVTADASGTSAIGQAQQGGLFTGLSTGLSFVRNMRTFQIDGSGDSSLRFYRSAGAFRTFNHSGALGVSARVARGTTITLTENVTYSPTYYFFQQLFAATAAPSAQGQPAPRYLDEGANDSRAYAYRTAVTLHHGLTRRSSIQISGSYRYIDLAQVSNLSDQVAFDYGGQYRYRLTRGSTLELGYSYQEGDHRYGAREGVYAAHDLRVGLDLDRPLKLTRGTTLSFDVGSTMRRAPLGAESVAIGSVRRTQTATVAPLQYDLAGNAVLTHRFGRTWNASLVYDRTFKLIEGIGVPLVGEGVALALGGSITRRLTFGGSTAYTVGEMLTPSMPPFETYRDGLRLDYAAAPWWGLTLEYLHYFYDFSRSDVLLMPGMAPRVARNSLRAGVSMRLPIAR